MYCIVVLDCGILYRCVELWYTDSCVGLLYSVYLCWIVLYCIVVFGFLYTVYLFWIVV